MRKQLDEKIQREVQLAKNCLSILEDKIYLLNVLNAMEESTCVNLQEMITYIRTTLQESV